MNTNPTILSVNDCNLDNDTLEFDFSLCHGSDIYERYYGYRP